MNGIKYDIIADDTIQYKGRTLYRIKALKSFADVSKGDKGGYIEHMGNLSQLGDCWIYDNAKVFANASIFNNAIVEENAEICGQAIIFKNARIGKNAKIYGYATIGDVAHIKQDGDMFTRSNYFTVSNITDHGYNITFYLGKSDILVNASCCNNVEELPKHVFCGTINEFEQYISNITRVEVRQPLEDLIKIARLQIRVE